MKEIRLAVVGFGGIAKTHLVALRAMPIIKNLPFVPLLDTLVTRDPERVRQQAEAIGFSHITSNLEYALEQRQLDVVDICTPNALHKEAYDLAVRHGKVVYCEKPLSDHYLISASMVKDDGGNSSHQTALVYRYHPAVLRIRESLRLGQIGQVLQCRIIYNRSGYLNAARPVSWRLNPGLTGGGAITDLGVHVLDLLYFLCGDIRSVTGKVHTYVKERPASSELGAPLISMEVDDWAHMTAYLESGVVATAEVSRIAWGEESFKLHIVGSQGSISCDLEKDYIPRIKRLDGSSPPVPAPASLELSTDEKTTLGMSVDCHFASLNHFLHRLIGMDRWDLELAPKLEDCARAEYWIHEVLKESGVGEE